MISGATTGSPVRLGVSYFHCQSTLHTCPGPSAIATQDWPDRHRAPGCEQASGSRLLDRFTFSTANEPVGNIAITMAAIRSNRVENMMNYLGGLLTDRNKLIIVT